MKKIISKLSFVLCNLSFVILLLTSPVLAQPDLGTITPPAGIPSTSSSNPTAFVANLINRGLTLLVIVCFIAAFVYIILGGLKFITSGGDPKAVEGARSQITWGIIGLVVVICAYAIIRVVEIFFNISLVSGAFSIPIL